MLLSGWEHKQLDYSTFIQTSDLYHWSYIYRYEFSGFFIASRFLKAEDVKTHGVFKTIFVNNYRFVCLFDFTTCANRSVALKLISVFFRVLPSHTQAPG